jgi:putative FmdB family regulatory protein
MPLYEYECDACGGRFELIRRFSDPPADTCAICGAGPVRKLFSSPAIQFKGSGFYITDYARKDQKAGGKGEQGEKSEGAASGDTGSAKDQATTKDQAPKDKAVKKDDKPSGGTGGTSGDKAPAAKSSSSESTKAKSPSE